jgi:DnaK suppressor protein
MAMTECPYTPEFLSAQRERLEAERERVLAEIEAGSEDLLAWADGDAVEVDQHPADAAAALTEQELDLTLIQNSRGILGEIDDALLRLAEGDYGWDGEAGAWIREERLEALPWARREVAGQERLEGLRRPARDSYSHDPDLTQL